MKAPLILSIVAMMSLSTSCKGTINEQTLAPGTPETPVSVKTRIKVASFNIRYSNTSVDKGDNSWEKRKAAVVKMLNTVQPAVIGIQESRTDQRTYLKSSLPQYTMIEIPGTGSGTGANVTLSYDNRYFEAVRSGHYFLSATPEKASACWDAASTAWRATIWGEFKEITSGKSFYVFCTHYPESSADNAARLNCTRLNIAKMKEIAGENAPLLIVGDMNCSYSESDPKRTALTPYYEWMEAARDCPDTDRYYSFNNFGSGSSTPTRNLDHIFYKNVTPISFRTDNSWEYGVKYISDHYPIYFISSF